MLELLKVSFLVSLLGDARPTVGDICRPASPCKPTGYCLPYEQECFPEQIPCEPDMICTPTILP